MKTPGIYVAGLGSYLPETTPAEEAVEQGLYDPDDYDWYGWTGAAVAGEMSAPDMAIRAAHQAVSRSRLSSWDIDLHMHAHIWPQGPQGWSPQHYILRNVTDRDAPSFMVWQACAGMLSATELAASHLIADPDRGSALVTGADNVGTPDFNRWAFGLQNGVIGDAASAVLLSRREGFARLVSVNSGSTADLEQLYRGNEPIFPPSSGDGRQVDFQERLKAFGADLATTVDGVVSRQGELRAEIALRTLAEAGIGPEEVTRVAHVFTGQESYLKTILDPMGVSSDKGLLEYGRQFGHTTVNDQFIGLDHLVTTGQVGPGDHVLMVAHGGGTAIACAVVRIEQRPSWAAPGPGPTASTDATATGVPRLRMANGSIRSASNDQNGGR